MSDALKKLRLLFVEDEANLARQMEDLLGPRVRYFEWASDGREGLERFRTLNPDIVITDITMPRLDGLEMSRRIHEISPEIPIVVLSAYSDKEKLLGAIDVGIAKYFIKPFDPEELLEYLEHSARELVKHQVVRILPDYRFNRFEGILYRDGRPLSLTRREKAFLQALINEPDHLLDVAAIKTLLWPGEEVTDDAVRVFLNRLRNKTGKDLIRNRSGEGYYLQVER